VIGPVATAQGRLRVFAGDHRGAHSHCNDSAHAAKTSGSVTLFKRALNHWPIHGADAIAVRECNRELKAAEEEFATLAPRTN
jgi:hypothetical protein